MTKIKKKHVEVWIFLMEVLESTGPGGSVVKKDKAKNVFVSV